MTTKEFKSINFYEIKDAIGDTYMWLMTTLKEKELRQRIKEWEDSVFTEDYKKPFDEFLKDKGAVFTEEVYPETICTEGEE